MRRIQPAIRAHSAGDRDRHRQWQSDDGDRQTCNGVGAKVFEAVALAQNRHQLGSEQLREAGLSWRQAFHDSVRPSRERWDRRPPVFAPTSSPSSRRSRAGSLCRDRRRRTPRPTPSLRACSPISSTPAASRAATTLIRVSTLPRTLPSLASILWIVGKETPERSASVFWSRPIRAAGPRASTACRRQHGLNSHLGFDFCNYQLSIVMSKI